MKKILFIVIASMGVLSSCIDHPESRRAARRNQLQDSLSVLRKRVVKPVGGFVKCTFLVDTIYQVGDTISINKSFVVIIK